MATVKTPPVDASNDARLLLQHNKWPTHDQENCRYIRPVKIWQNRIDRVGLILDLGLLHVSVSFNELIGTKIL